MLEPVPASARVGAAQFLLVLDLAAVTVALPQIERDLGFGRAELALLVSGHAMSFAALLLPARRVARVLGSRRTVLVGAGLFVAASSAVGLAATPTAAVLARVAQGAGAALLAPAAWALLSAAFARGGARIARCAALPAAGGAAGLVLGGALVELAGWRWVFLLNALAGTGVLLGRGRIGPDPDLGAARDAAGRAGIGLGVPAARGRLGGIVVGANLVTVLLSAVGCGASFVLSLYLQRVLGLSPLLTGLVSLPQAVVAALAALAAARLVARTGERPLLTAATAALTTGLVLLIGLPASPVGPAGTYLVHVLPGTVLAAAGLGVGLTVGTPAATRGPRPGAAFAVLTAGQQVGAAVGLGALTAVAVPVTAAAGAVGFTAAEASMAGLRIGVWALAGIATAAAVLAAAASRDRGVQDHRPPSPTAGAPGWPGSGRGHTIPAGREEGRS